MSRRPPRTSPDPIDKYVGSRVRARRVGLRISQTKLGDAIGVTFQQVQKYENGTNRIGASHLYKISRELGVDVAYFFDNMPEDFYSASLADPYGLSDGPQEPFQNDPLTSRDSLALVHDYQRIHDEHLRQKITQFVRAMANSLNHDPHDCEED